MTEIIILAFIIYVAMFGLSVAFVPMPRVSNKFVVTKKYLYRLVSSSLLNTTQTLAVIALFALGLVVL